MRRNLLLAGLLTTFSLVAKSQVGINTSNPQGVFNIDGLKNNPTTGVPTAAQAKDDLVTTSNGNLGLGLTAPGTTLDVNGAITNRETALPVVGNAVSIPVNVSQVQLTGAATANVAITAFAAPNPGQRLIVYNNTTGGFGATLDGVTIPNGKALEFVFSNSFWRSTDGGAAAASSVNIYNTDGSLTGNRTVTQGANTLAFTGTQTNAFSVDGNTLSVDAANGRVGVGTTTPDTKLTISTPDNSFGLNHTNGTINLKTFIGGGVATVGTNTANDLRFMTNNTQKMTVTSAGDVGIGTVTPTNKLVVVGSNAQPSALGTANTNATFRIDGSSNHALDFGTYTNSPFGSYISSQNKTAATGLPLVLNPVGGNVGVGTNAPNNSALLDLTSTSAGLLMPRMTTAQMNAIAAPAAGLQVYNTSENCTFLYNGSNWRSLCARTFQQSGLGALLVTIGSSTDLTQTISLAGTQNVTIQVSFNPMLWSNLSNGNTSGTYQIIIDGTSVTGNMRYSTQNAGNFLYRYSSIGSWTTTLAPGNHTIIFRITATGGSEDTNAEDRRMIVTVN